MKLQTEKSNKFSHYSEQTIGAAASIVNMNRIEELTQSFIDINETEKILGDRQELSLASAIDQVNKIRRFLGDPEHIIGSEKTKHGEIAEVIEVNNMERNVSNKVIIIVRDMFLLINSNM